MQFLKVLGGKGWALGLFLFCFVFPANLNFFFFFITLGAMFRPLSKACLPNLREDFITAQKNFKKGSDSGGLFSFA